MSFFVVKNPTDVVIVLSEVYVRILTNILYSISNDILQMKGEGDVLSTQLEKRDLFLDYSIRFISAFYFDNVYSLLKLALFLHMYRV